MLGSTNFVLLDHMSRKGGVTVCKIHKAKNHLGTHQANRKVTEKPGTTLLTSEFLAYHIRQVEQQDTTRENKVKKLIEKFGDQKHEESFIHSGHEPDAEDQQVQQRIEGFDRRLEQHRDLRTFVFQTALARLQCLLAMLTMK